MKRILLILLLAMAVPVIAQTSNSPHPYKATKNKGVAPKADTGAKSPAHKVGGAAVPSAKSGSVDAQLKQLEKQQSKTLSSKPAGAKRTPATTKTPSKTPARTGEAMNFKHEQGKAGISNNQPRSGNQHKPTHGRVNGR